MRPLFLILITCLLLSCDSPVISPVPSFPVNLELNINHLDSDLVPALAAKSFTEPRLSTDRLGFGGVLVVNGHGNNGILNLFAFDLACPYEVDRNVIVIPDDMGKARCPQCGSVYITMWGTGMPEKESVSKYPLRSFAVRQERDNVFRVVN